MTIADTTLSNNPFGGIDNEVGTLTVNDSTIANNGQQATNGGGILNGGGTLLVNDSAIAQNSATGQGGGIDISSGNATLDNTIVAGNTNATAADISGAVIANYSLIGDNTGSGLTAAPVGTPDANGNVIGTSATPIGAAGAAGKLWRPDVARWQFHRDHAARDRQPGSWRRQFRMVSASARPATSVGSRGR